LDQEILHQCALENISIHPRALEIILNIIDRRHNELALQKEQQILGQLIERAPFGLYKGRQDGTCLSVNQTYTHLTGLSPSQAYGYGWMQIMSPEDVKQVVAHWSLLKKGIPFDQTFRIHTLDGTERWLRLFWTPDDILNKDDVALGMIVDVTEEVKARQVLEQRAEESARATRFKSEFLAMVSHEIRTPLNGILGMASLIEGENLTEDERHMLSIIEDCGKSLLELINETLELSKIEAGSMELDNHVMNIRDLIRSVHNMFAVTAKNVEVKLAVDPDVPTFIVSDAAKLKRILINLVGNAVKFTAEGHVHATCHVLTHEGQNYVLQFQVEDTGIGIDEEGIHRLFRPYSQVDSASHRYGGTGLGLSISKQIVEKMNGEIRVSSVPGRGSCFTFTVQVLAADPSTLPEPTITSTSLPPTDITNSPATNALTVATPTANDDDLTKQLKSLSILLVEDNKINQQLAMRMLSKLGLTADKAEDGQQAVDAVHQHEYDLILMDLSMPGMSGLEATTLIRNDLPSFYARPPWIVALTANALTSDRQQCQLVGMNDFVSKPFSLNDLRRLLTTCVRHHQAH
jgi:PAS domain S-box-containing protein